MKLTQFIFEGRKSGDPFEEHPTPFKTPTAEARHYKSVDEHYGELAAELQRKMEALGFERNKHWRWLTTTTEDPWEVLDTKYAINPTGLSPDQVKLLKRLLLKRNAFSTKQLEARAKAGQIEADERQRAYEQKQARRAEKATAAETAWEQGNTIAEASVPREIDIYRDRIPCAYHLGAHSQYAGDPDLFPFTRPKKATYQVINNALIRNGIPKFHVLYSADTVFHSSDGQSSTNTSFNVVGGGCGPAGGQNSVVWAFILAGRRYVNGLFISGAKIKIVDFELLSEQEQDDFLKKYYKP